MSRDLGDPSTHSPWNCWQSFYHSSISRWRYMYSIELYSFYMSMPPLYLAYERRGTCLHPAARVGNIEDMLGFGDSSVT